MHRNKYTNIYTYIYIHIYIYVYIYVYRKLVLTPMKDAERSLSLWQIKRICTLMLPAITYNRKTKAYKIQNTFKEHKIYD